ncbi:GntR family transcriptional regulator [Microbacterium invictum]|uniref:DNA-binding GntR family transcriptional regulator n=1 Tax=Microbacterium invictum TaxID=515415 RepID=A0AA40VNH1_9MICO|nr:MULTISPECIES: GntR family transcriptional regulator [Microbacterium]MBB4140433.1 DNA-binding GntR family transcriptional regulator [Microbacterium invictum]
MNESSNHDLDPMERASLVSFAHREIRARIANGIYTPGARITESAAAVDLDVSRASIREALRALSAEGVVVTRPRGGVTVPTVSRGELENLFECRATLQSGMVFSATKTASAEDLIELRRLSDAPPATASGDSRAESVDDAFFRKVGGISGNPWMVRLHTQVCAQLERYRLTFPYAWTGAQHAARRSDVLDAMARRDAVTAAQLTTRYVDDLLFLLLSTHEEQADH